MTNQAHRAEHSLEDWFLRGETESGKGLKVVLKVMELWHCPGDR
jgi:hypothetical protein